MEKARRLKAKCHGVNIERAKSTAESEPDELSSIAYARKTTRDNTQSAKQQQQQGGMRPHMLPEIHPHFFLFSSQIVGNRRSLEFTIKVIAALGGAE